MLGEDIYNHATPIANKGGKTKRGTNVRVLFFLRKHFFLFPEKESEGLVWEVDSRFFYHIYYRGHKGFHTE